MSNALSRRNVLLTGATLAGLGLATRAQAAETLTFAWSPAPQTPNVDVALAEDAFAKAGLDLKIVSFPTGREAFEAVTGGQADVASMAELPAVIGALRGQEFGIIGDLARYKGSRIITTMASGIASPAQLAGKKVGVTLGTNTDYFLAKVLEGAGVTAEIINAAPADLLPALIRGDVDAIAPFPNFYPAAQKALGDKYRDIRSGVYESHFVLAASKAAINGKADALKRFLGALKLADKIVAADADKAAAAVVATVKGNVDASAVKALWSDTAIGLTLSPDLPALLLSQAQWVLGKGLVKAAKPVTADMIAGFIAPASLRTVAPEAVSL